MKLRRFLFEGEILRLMGFTVLVKPLAMVTQMLTARYFGASSEFDAYAFALFLVTFLGTAVGNGFGTVIIPHITRLRESLSPREVEAYQNAVVLLFYLPVALVMVLLTVRGDLLVDLVGAQLPPETRDHAVRMTRFLAVPGALLALVKLLSSLLNLIRRYRIPGLMLPLHTVMMLVTLVLLHGRLGIWALPVGCAVSYLLQTLLIGYRSLATGAVTFARPTLPRGELALVWGLSWPIFIGQALLLLNTFVDKWFAAGLPVGSISYITYSMSLINFGHQLFSQSLVVVMFTRMSELLARNDLAGCDRYLRVNIVRVANLVVPACVVLFAVSPEIVRVLYQRGAFTAADGVETSGTLAFYVLGLQALVINGIVARIFHALRRVRERVWLNLQYILTNVVGNMLLVRVLATKGLAISSSAAIILHLVLALLLLARMDTGLRPLRYLGIIATTWGMGAAAYGAYRLLGLDGFAGGLGGGDGVVAALAVAGVKAALIVALYAVQIPVFLGYFRR